MQQQRQRELGINDYVAIARRRLVIIIVPAVLVTILAVAVSFVLQARYQSVTLILIEQPKVPTDYVRSVVNEDLNGRLARMTEQIFSRTRLEPIIERFGIYGNDKLTIDEKLEQLRKAVVVTPIKSSDEGSRSGSPGFTVAVTLNQARLAQQVCGEIAAMFLSENLKLREQSAEGTTDFLKTQLDDAKRSLDEQDAKLAAFQSQNFGQLPGQEQSNQNMLGSLNTQLDAATQALNRLEQDKGYAEVVLAQQKAAYATSREASESDSDVAAPLSKEHDTQIEQAQNRLTELEARYTPDHPDVLKARRELEALKGNIDSASAATAAATGSTKKKSATEPAQLQQLEFQIGSMEKAIAAKKADQDRIQQQIRNFQTRLQASPIVQEKFKGITRDYEIAQKSYNDLLAKKTQSEMATDLERRQEGEQFRIVDPPNLPEKPTFPNRLLFAFGGLIGGLIVGGGLAGLVEFQDKSLRNDTDVLFHTKLETLATIPVIGSEKPVVTKRRGFRLRRKAPELATGGRA